MLDSGSLSQLGTDRKGDGEMPNASQEAPLPNSVSEERKDYFQERDGERFAGTHLIVDLWEAEGLDDIPMIEQALRDSVEASGATLLHIHLHHFTPSGGVSGVAVLAESHISIHTWPECDYAALDIFMCGGADPHAAIPVLERAFKPGRTGVEEIRRGKLGGGKLGE